MRKLSYVLMLAAAVFGLAMLILMFKHTVWPWLEIHTGTVNESGPYYGFWSGFGSDIGEATIILGLVTAGRHLNCVTQGCWRIALHKSKDPKTGVEYRQCHRHHPDLKDHAHPHFWQHHFTDEHLADVHQRIKDDRAADPMQ